MEMKKPIIKKDNLKKVENISECSIIKIEDAALSEVTFHRDIEELKFSAVSGENLVMSECLIEDMTLVDCVLTKCDFTGTVSNQTTLLRVEINGSRIQGTQLMNTKMSDVTFKNSKCSQSSFRFSAVKDVAFINCDLKEVDFQGAQMENVLFENCNLEMAQFSRAKMVKVNISSSNIENIKISKESFEKVIVSTSQALYIASIFGLVIED
jgi:uncharacterized protein YjbI with pentapeptide repeats